MAIVLAFDGLSGTGKTSISHEVAERLSAIMTVRWVPHTSAFGINHLRDLLYRYRDEWQIDSVSRQHIKAVLHRQQWLHLIEPYMEAVDVLVIDNPCLPITDIWGGIQFEGYVYPLDLHVITLCDITLIPERIANRSSGVYEVDLSKYTSDGEKAQSMQFFSERAALSETVFSLDTSGRQVVESADIILVECARRFGWNVASLCQSGIEDG